VHYDLNRVEDVLYLNKAMTILFVDPDRSVLAEMSSYLKSMDLNIVTARSLDEAAEIIQTQLFDAIVADVGMQNGSVLRLLEYQQTFNRNAPIIVTADFGHVQQAVTAVKNGAHNFIQKPYDAEDLYQRILKALEFRQLELEAMSLRGERELIYKPENFISDSPEMEKVLQMVSKVAKTDATILLTGETGTGKELVSGAIHYNSHRARKAFVKVNCAALPIQLLESELFGHEKGAFTGADKVRIGRFEQANEGSILLDEVAEMEMGTQVKLLRVLQERVFERLGSNRQIKLDVRVMTATNRNLYAEVQENRFRQDLYYRLNVVNIEIPPLRERKSDIIPLAQFFLTKFNGEFGKSVEKFNSNAMQMLLQHTWPGNVRELRNTVERAVLMTDHNIIGEQDLNIIVPTSAQPAAGQSDGGGEAGRGIRSSGIERVREGQQPVQSGDTFQYVRIPQEGLSLKEIEEDMIRQALQATHFVQKDAAKILGISPRALNYKIAKYGIKNPHWHKNT
jgi:DNA-binding NtrC family response regulator